MENPEGILIFIPKGTAPDLSMIIQADRIGRGVCVDCGQEEVANPGDRCQFCIDEENLLRLKGDENDEV
jgi:hypothetical protein